MSTISIAKFISCLLFSWHAVSRYTELKFRLASLMALYRSA